ncbi:MAG: hypothetical protein JXA18_16560 [Chitinispirillaceae bacterium]|nr:hypothetical protein [Chitinispirillaceae bacterium]
MKPQRATIVKKLVLLTAIAAFVPTASPVFSAGKNTKGRHQIKPERRDHRGPVRQRVQRHAPPAPRHYPCYSYRHGRFYRWGPLGRVVVPAPFGKIVLSLPGAYRTLRIGPRFYYHCNGVYYTRHAHGYKVVTAPRIRFLPYPARRMVIGGDVFFLYNDVYYCYRDGFYEACEPPAMAETGEGKTATVMVENSNGSRTPVELEPLGGNQWKGPRGEIYDGLPSNEQLREGYGF